MRLMQSRQGGNRMQSCQSRMQPHATRAVSSSLSCQGRIQPAPSRPCACTHVPVRALISSLCVHSCLRLLVPVRALMSRPHATCAVSSSLPSTLPAPAFQSFPPCTSPARLLPPPALPLPWTLPSLGLLHTSCPPTSCCVLSPSCLPASPRLSFLLPSCLPASVFFRSYGLSSADLCVRALACFWSCDKDLPVLVTASMNALAPSH